MKVRILAVILVLCCADFGLAIEEVEVQAPQKIKISSDPTEIIPLSSSKRKTPDFEESFASSLDLRQRKRVSIGLQGMGKVGLLGATLDFNFSGNNLGGGFVGTGQGFNTFGFSWKRYFDGENFTPFVGLSFSQWYNASEKSKTVSSSTPSYLANTLLNDNEKATGQYNLNVFVPSVGIQYFFLDGDWKNSSITGELVLLRPIDRSSQVVSAAFGYAYTF